jgi:hypothetical protein
MIMAGVFFKCWSLQSVVVNVVMSALIFLTGKNNITCEVCSMK